MLNWLAEQEHTIGIVLGVLFGLIARLTMLRTDYRQYPTYPHGRIIHVALGVIAAGLGSVAVPSLIERDYTAVTFLSLAAQQFREVRNMERETLGNIDDMELVPRGSAYIEGIAMVFEGRNYLVIFVAFVTAFFSIVLGWYWGIAAGAVSVYLANRFKTGKSIRHIATVHSAEVRVEGPNLWVDDVYIMNVGLEETRKTIRERGMGLILVPKDADCRVTLANLGQRQALLHDVSTLLGVHRDEGEPALLPLTKLDLNDGRLALFLLPQEQDMQRARSIIEGAPVLESAIRMPTETHLRPAGKEGA
ncbi:YIEGIA family protein [Paenibacillus xerothermodurans]|uniref:YIEGIA protein n=1 Tax=Paenibacillus xerothermodurans TaxID=1977292 RepID=A0A2W1NTF1_PAEXE|nr:YIEGIA family protein [Paenibacillus xerothermodurans]PZE21963.1 hypothetical protein CBW46_006075 [Paenibacillus xerothermodurans]